MCGIFSMVSMLNKKADEIPGVDVDVLVAVAVDGFWGNEIGTMPL